MLWGPAFSSVLLPAMPVPPVKSPCWWDPSGQPLPGPCSQDVIRAIHGNPVCSESYGLLGGCDRLVRFGQALHILQGAVHAGRDGGGGFGEEEAETLDQPHGTARAGGADAVQHARPPSSGTNQKAHRW